MKTVALLVCLLLAPIAAAQFDGMCPSADTSCSGEPEPPPTCSGSPAIGRWVFTIYTDLSELIVVTWFDECGVRVTETATPYCSSACAPCVARDVAREVHGVPGQICMAGKRRRTVPHAADRREQFAVTGFALAP